MPKKRGNNEPLLVVKHTAVGVGLLARANAFWHTAVAC